jgi:UDP:flavonoid glycosyltransferase YjiC (YdhE family)
MDLPPGVHSLPSAPHDWLFPRLAAVVHHGGAGTTAAGFAAGIPAVVVPHMADQPYWGRKVAALGVGPRPVPRHRLTSERLASAIRTAVTDPEMRARAAALGARVRAEDGTGVALGIIRDVVRP